LAKGGKVVIWKDPTEGGGRAPVLVMAMYPQAKAETEDDLMDSITMRDMIRQLGFTTHVVDLFPVSPDEKASEFDQRGAAKYADRSWTESKDPIGKIWLDMAVDWLADAVAEGGLGVDAAGPAVVYVAGHVQERVFKEAVEKDARTHWAPHMDTRLAMMGLGVLHVAVEGRPAFKITTVLRDHMSHHKVSRGDSRARAAYRLTVDLLKLLR
jgi:hypothetical protein